MDLDPNRDIWNTSLPVWERGQEAGRTRLLNQDLLHLNVVDVHNVLDKYKLRHWLSHGTLLGAYRDGNYIPHDDDADLGADFSQREAYKPAIEDLRRMGFYIPDADPSKPVGLENAPWFDLHCIRNGEKVEIWFFEKQEDGWWIYDQNRCGNTLRHEAEYYDTLDTFNFRGTVFNTPHNIESYLEMMYDRGWKTPDKNKKYNNRS